MGSPICVSDTINTAFDPGPVESKISCLCGGLYEYVVRFRCGHGKCKIVGQHSFFLSVSLCSGLLRLSVLPVGSHDFGIEQGWLGYGLAEFCLGGGWICLGNESEYSFFCSIYSERKTVLGNLPRFLLLHIDGMAGAFVLEGICL